MIIIIDYACSQLTESKMIMNVDKAYTHSGHHMHVGSLSVVVCMLFSCAFMLIIWLLFSCVCMLVEYGCWSVVRVCW